MKEYANKSIECSIENCANHCGGENYCALKKIKVSPTGVTNPTIPAATNCASFELR